jgi:hypothetical protein
VGVGGGAALEDPASIAFVANSLLEPEAFAASTEYDALN